MNFCANSFWKSDIVIRGAQKSLFFQQRWWLLWKRKRVPKPLQQKRTTSQYLRLGCLQSSNSLERPLNQCKHEHTLSQSTHLDSWIRCREHYRCTKRKIWLMSIPPLGKPIPTYACCHPHGRTHVATLRVIKLRTFCPVRFVSREVWGRIKRKYNLTIHRRGWCQWPFSEARRMFGCHSWIPKGNLLRGFPSRFER